MIKLNLAYPDRSDIAFDAISYPDGQHDIRILNFLQSNKTALSYEDIKNSEIEIVSRFNNFIHLEFILAATQSLRELGCEDISLRIPSLFSARCDRKFVEGGNSYLKQITAPILNMQNYSSVTVVDVHNFKQAKRRIHNLINETVLPKLVIEAISDLRKTENKKCYIISPDKGAKPRTESVCSELVHLIGNFTSVIQCDKVRDMHTSKIIGLDVPLEDFGGTDCIIIDDLIDGGRTFIDISEILKNRNCGKIYLVLAHGIFSSGFDKLRTCIDKIYVTNSFKDINDETGFINQIDIF